MPKAEVKITNNILILPSGQFPSAGVRAGDRAAAGGHFQIPRAKGHSTGSQHRITGASLQGKVTSQGGDFQENCDFVCPGSSLRRAPPIHSGPARADSPNPYLQVHNPAGSTILQVHNPLGRATRQAGSHTNDGSQHSLGTYSETALSWNKKF